MQQSRKIGRDKAVAQAWARALSKALVARSNFVGVAYETVIPFLVRIGAGNSGAIILRGSIVCYHGQQQHTVSADAMSLGDGSAFKSRWGSRHHTQRCHDASMLRGVQTLQMDDETTSPYQCM